MEKPTTLNVATTSLVGCLASPHAETRVYTAPLGRSSHSSARDAIPVVSLTLSLSLFTFESPLALVFRFTDTKTRVASALMDHLFLLDPTPSSSLSLSLALSFALSPFFYRATSPTRDHPLSIYLFSLSLSLSFSAYLSTYLSQADIRASRKRLPGTFLADDDGASARATHFPLFPLLSLFLPRSLLSFNSPPPLSLPRVCTYNCTRARAHTHMSGSAARTSRAYLYVAVDRFSVSPLFSLVSSIA